MFEIYEGKQTPVHVYISVGIHVSECLLGKLLFPRFLLWLFRPKATCMSLTRDIIGLCGDPRGIFDENHSLPFGLNPNFAELQAVTISYKSSVINSNIRFVFVVSRCHGH